MKNSEIIKKALEEMENNHINLYHDISKEEIVQYIENIKNIDELSEIEFDYELLKFVALFKDAHTIYFAPYLYIDKEIFFFEDKIYLKENGEYKEIVSFYDCSVNQFLEKILPTIRYETDEFSRVLINDAINNGYYYKMCDLLRNNVIICNLKINNKIEQKEINIINRAKADEFGLLNNEPYYSFKIIDNILYVKYRKCSEYENYSFAEFNDELKQEIKEKNITKYILDLRGNRGGNSEIIIPFENLVEEQNMKGVLLIDNYVFSSGRFAVKDFKKKFRTILIGENTGGSSKSYGWGRRFKVEDKEFSVSTHLWDFSEIFGYAGTIKPDIEVKKSLQDIEKNYDPQLEKAIEVVGIF